jgi:gamma-glutamyltranspeptidase/glutathione hydrolase
MRRAAVAVGSDPTAQDAAQAHLDAGGDAVGAVVCGFFAAAGDSPGVLFGPLGLLVAQIGVGVRAFDGRQRQPGLGARRARGLMAEDAVPVAARVGVPSSIAALLVALRYGRSAPLSKIMSAGVSLAKKAGCDRRAGVLEQIGRLGAAALASQVIARPLIHLAGPSEGGALGLGDLEAIPELDHLAGASASQRFVPWLHDRIDPSQMPESEWQAQALRQQGLSACDAAGGVAALCYDNAISGLRVDALELVLPLYAVPARRGAARVAPGRFLPAPAPLYVDVSSSDTPVTATVALAERPPLSVRAL